MKKYIVFALLLTIAAQGAWAIQENYYPRLINPTPSEGPWTYDAVNSKARKISEDTYSFNQLDHTAMPETGNEDHRNHPTIYQFHDGDGIGFAMCCDIDEDGAFGVYSTYYHHDTVPAYTRRKLNWQFSVAGKADGIFDQLVALYAHDDLFVLKNQRVVFYEPIPDWEPDDANCIGYLYLKNDEDSKTKNATFDFDNRNGNKAAVKSWYLMLTQIIGSSSRSAYIHYWGSFEHKNSDWTTYYYKHLTFDANGGIGTMATQEIENSDNLTANAFTRVGYAFQGWATSADGPVVYTDGQAITATAENKGPVTLYAVWKPTVATVMAAIDAIGEVVYTAECKAHIDGVRALYNELSAEDKNAVINYSTLVAAEATYLAIQNVVTKITAIGEVTYTPESKALIDAARGAYALLTEAQKPLVINYSALVEAEAQYAVLPVVAAIDAIGEVTIDSGEDIADARAAYNALSNTRKSLVTNYAKLLAAEAAYADLGKTTVLYVDKAGTDTIHTQRKSIEYPDLPAGASKWQTVERSVSADSTIVIKAVQ